MEGGIFFLRIEQREGNPSDIEPLTLQFPPVVSNQDKINYNQTYFQLPNYPLRQSFFFLTLFLFEKERKTNQSKKKNSNFF